MSDVVPKRGVVKPPAMLPSDFGSMPRDEQLRVASARLEQARRDLEAGVGHAPLLRRWVSRLEERTIPAILAEPVTQPDAVEPTLGEGTRAASARAREAGLSREETKLLILLAAYRDSGERSPPVRWLTRRMGWGTSHRERFENARRMDALLKALGRRRMLYVQWRAGEARRNVYLLTCLGDRIPPTKPRRTTPD